MDIVYLLLSPVYLPELQDIPAELAKESFTKAFEVAQETALSPRDRLLYEASLKSARDAYAELVSARDKGLTEGRAEERKEIARSLLARGLTSQLVMDTTGLTADEIAQLQRSP